MTDQEKLFEVLGELLYAVAKADGVVQNEEKEVLNKIFQNHPWASSITWSFNYEASKGHSVEDVYHKVIDFCKHYGPAPEYAEFIDAMELLAKANEVVDENEEKIMTSFTKDLTNKFHNDLNELM